MKFATFFLVLTMLGKMTCTSSDKVLKFVSLKSEPVYLCLDEILRFDTVNSVIKVTHKAASKLQGLDLANTEAFVRNIEDKWERIVVVSARSSSRSSPQDAIVINHDKLFFYSETEIVVAGTLWKALALRKKIPIN